MGRLEECDPIAGETGGVKLGESRRAKNRSQLLKNLESIFFHRFLSGHNVKIILANIFPVC
jgi:hypothetical protein